MHDSKAVLLNSYQGSIKGEPVYKIAFYGKDTFTGKEIEGFTAKCSIDDFVKVKDCPMGSSLDIIYTTNKGYTNVEMVVSCGDDSGKKK